MRKLLLISFFQFCFIAGVMAANSTEDALLQTEISNIKNPKLNVYSAGQPTKAQLKQAKESGVKHIVNLRPRSEQDWDEKAYVNSLGMRYHHIPVAGPEDINQENAAKLEMALAKNRGEPILVHCASGNRVGALVALNEGVEHQDIDAAITTGKQWGLTRLEPVVREKLKELVE
ncbi:protein tyrosine phosphatase family protein [Alteromonas aquimaris]|nr:protein tyrosine phosphatase family protein [Alteromonas aquimaris]